MVQMRSGIISVIADILSWSLFVLHTFNIKTGSFLLKMKGFGLKTINVAFTFLSFHIKGQRWFEWNDCWKKVNAKAEARFGKSPTFVRINSKKVPFIYYVSTFIAQNLTFHKNWVFSSKQKRLLFKHYILTKFSCCTLNFL